MKSLYYFRGESILKADNVYRSSEERIFPVHAPVIEKIELVRKGEVRRAKLYYLRDLRGKAAKIRERRGADDLETLYSSAPAAVEETAAPVVDEVPVAQDAVAEAPVESAEATEANATDAENK